jgi:hypothetical protein
MCHLDETYRAAQPGHILMKSTLRENACPVAQSRPMPQQHPVLASSKLPVHKKPCPSIQEF